MCDGGHFLFLLCQVIQPITWLSDTMDLIQWESKIFPNINIYIHRGDYEERRVYSRAYSIIACLPAVRTTVLLINLSREYHNLHRKFQEKFLIDQTQQPKCLEPFNINLLETLCSLLFNLDYFPLLCPGIFHNNSMKSLLNVTRK